MILLLNAASILTFSSVQGASKGLIRVEGWPITYNTQYNHIVKDPILGATLCPALTRLNLNKGESETALAKKIKVIHSKKQTQWRISLYKNARWWSGEPLSAAEVADILSTKIPPILARLYEEKEHPRFTVKTDQNDLSINWKAPIKFGPYLLNQIPISLLLDGELDCAGKVKTKIEELTNSFDLWSGKKEKPEKKLGTVKIMLPSDFKPKGKIYKPDLPLKCPVKVDLPIVSAIQWNPRSALGGNNDFRIAITHLTPRGSLLRNASGHLGDLLSAPIIRAHPGYNKAVYVRSYSPSTAMQILGRSEFNKYRQTRDKKNGKSLLEVRLLVEAKLKTPIIRILEDSLRIAQVKLIIVRNPSSQYDGILKTVSIPWPSQDVGDLLQGFEKVPKVLTQRLQDYRFSLTNKKPNFALLKKAHRDLYSLEPLTVLVQHRACVEIRPTLTKKVANQIAPEQLTKLIERKLR